MTRGSYGMPYPNQAGVWTTNLNGTDREFVAIKSAAVGQPQLVLRDRTIAYVDW